MNAFHWQSQPSRIDLRKQTVDANRQRGTARAAWKRGTAGHHVIRPIDYSPQREAFKRG